MSGGGRQLVVQEGQEIAVSESYVSSGSLQAGVDLDPGLAEYWGASAPHFHAVAVRAISTACDFAGEDAPALINSFDQLPGGCQLAIMDQLAAGTVSKHHIKLRGDEEAFLTGTRTGAILAQKWGSGNRGQFKIAMAMKRMDHILDNLNDTDAEIAMNWLKTLPPEHEAAIWICLAEG